MRHHGIVLGTRTEERVILSLRRIRARSEGRILPFGQDDKSDLGSKGRYGVIVHEHEAMSEVFHLADELGPAKVVHVHDPALGLRGIVVVDNVAAGPSIGGLRMAEDVSLSECARLARAMTLKNAAAELPHGGGKSVLFANPKMPRDRKEQLVRCFASALRGEADYIFGPDMGTDETCMAWVKDEIGRCVGLPRELGGIPLDEIGATGWGLSHAAAVAAARINLDLRGARVAIQGFGSVGKHAARFLGDQGAILVAASDSCGTIHDPEGLDIAALVRIKQDGGAVCDYAGGSKLQRDDVIDVECEIWIPAARPDVVDADNVHRLKAKLVVEGANIPFTPRAEEILHEKGVLVVPDFIANAGGVICAAMEYRGASEAAAFETIEEKVRANTSQVLDLAAEHETLPREAAFQLAVGRVRNAMSYKRWGIF